MPTSQVALYQASPRLFGPYMVLDANHVGTMACQCRQMRACACCGRHCVSRWLRAAASEPGEAVVCA